MNKEATVAALELIARHGPEAPLLGMIIHAEAALNVAPSLGVHENEIHYLRSMRDLAQNALEVLRDIPESPS